MKVWRNFHLTELRRAMNMMGAHKRAFLTSITLFAMIGAITVPIMAIGLRGFVNALTAADFSRAVRFLLIWAACYLAWDVTSPVWCYVSNINAKRAERDISLHLAHHVIRLSQAEADRRQEGSIFSTCLNDMNGLKKLYDMDFWKVIEIAGASISALLAMFLLDWRFALVTTALGLTGARVVAYFSGELGRAGDALQKNLSDSTIDYCELVKGAKVLRGFHLLPAKLSQIEDATRRECKTKEAAGKIRAKMQAVGVLAESVSFLTVLGAGAFFVLNGWADWGSILAISNLQCMAGYLFTECVQNLSTLQGDLACARRIWELLDQPEENTEVPAVNWTSACDESPLTAKGLRFSYDGEREILRDAEMTLNPRGLTLIMGESGVGKSTLMKLILGLYTPDQGCISIRGGAKNLRDVRERIAYVPQDGMLFSGSVRGNIDWEGTASDAEVSKAAEQAGISELLRTDRKLGENGKGLSGGQRQRLALARALHKKADILLLDEICASLDEANAEYIMDTVRKIADERPVVLITHQSRWTSLADKVFMMRDGRLTEVMP